ncbi:ribonuclease T2 [Stereum hirsutum FP-91666 SS1]|uniref:ribonuclease T2 n=1 Tax=Stereum hirsutum (strain FP-91666) TaxID=721885 RepID=UPI0004449D48|nr:ribonuclease T2 [Stereum hirsutum FP-91666 SS1]EIM82063.1 ribonuclease T2 [Stereum hirsutum FP-91666 SS1]
MQLLQAFLSLVPFFDNLQLDSNPSDLSHLATPPTHLNTCSGKLSSVPGYYNLSGGIDFSDPNVENILTGSGSSDPSGTSGSDGSGVFNPRRPVRGEGKQLRVHQRHHKHRTSAAVEPAQTCPDPAVLSCSTEAESGSVDSCCVVTPGGALVHVQLWDLDIGEADSFGIHGLWPDKCNGQFYENCDSSRDYSSSSISNNLPSQLKSFMETYWQSNDESPEAFWAHEWSTHGTCVSTLEPSCFSGYTSGAEATLYFQTIVNLFQELNVYQALSDAGITPSSSKKYSASAMQDAIQSGTSYTPDLVCTNGALTSVQFYLNALGPLQDGKFEQGEATRTSSCPSQISWKPKTVSS